MKELDRLEGEHALVSSDKACDNIVFLVRLIITAVTLKELGFNSTFSIEK